jgi:hypothetical protein
MDQMFSGPLMDVAAWTLVLLAYGSSTLSTAFGIHLLLRKPARRRVSILVKTVAALALVCGLGLAIAMTTALVRSGGV